MTATNNETASQSISVGAALGVQPLLDGLLEALGPGYHAAPLASADVVLIPASTATTADGLQRIVGLRQQRPAAGIVAITTGPAVPGPDTIAALDAGADAVVRVQTPRELAAH